MPSRNLEAIASNIKSPGNDYLALPRLGDLERLLQQASRESRAPSRWRVPTLFFFNRRRADCSVCKKCPMQMPAHWQAAAAMVQTITEQARLEPRLRHTLRAMPLVIKRLSQLAGTCTASAQLLRLLAVVDDEVVVVLHPASRCGWRMSVQGMATIGQFQRHFSEWISSHPGVALFRLGPEARWQWLRVNALASPAETGPMQHASPSNVASRSDVHATSAETMLPQLARSTRAVDRLIACGDFAETMLPPGRHLDRLARAYGKAHGDFAETRLAQLTHLPKDADRFEAHGDFAETLSVNCEHWLLEAMPLPPRSEPQGVRIMVLGTAVYQRQRLPAIGNAPCPARIGNVRELTGAELDQYFGAGVSRGIARQAA